jgi:UDP:flavonoid glycosyltransferase YjiC (YdhE family)
VQPGFVYFANQNNDTPTPRLSEFLAAGDAPVLFTQGSTAVHHPGDFYRVSLAAAKRLQRRAILIGAKTVPEVDSPDILTLPYAAYSQVFPHAAVNVHQGGSGTVGEAFRAGRPMLVVPYGWDQPDNASRVQRLGVGLHVPRTAYTVDTASSALAKLLRTAHFSNRAAEVRTQVATENGLATACTAIESILS